MGQGLSNGLLGLLLWGCFSGVAQAIPGESVSTVEAWIDAHPTLRPNPNERLVVNRAETPARRFTFRATVIPVAGLSPGLELRRIIRTEETRLVNIVDGVSQLQLEEAIRAIYDAAIYNDYRRAQIVYTYPDPAFGALTGEPSWRQGELREGDRFGYWVERIVDQNGFAAVGEVSVFLKEDLPDLQADLIEKSLR
ncbi:MAG: hypothetical protein HC812_14605 [Leptolyngbya sp. RL_3_1]|nr:hypothetical protein [Leptolyngbya sp. RL_3_1]